jgi:glycine cleavage system aminomethyltransferase T
MEVKDISDEVAMFAIQGPKAQATIQKLTKTDVSNRFKIGRLCSFLLIL